MEEEKITVSVVVPVYQTPLELLRRYLDSLEAQTLEGVEVRVSPQFATFAHIDYDEANACGFKKGDRGMILP